MMTNTTRAAAGSKVRYDTIRDAILTCAQVSLIYRTERTTKKWEKENLVSKPVFLLRSRPIGKQSGESVESVLTKKRKATMRRICRKGRF